MHTTRVKSRIAWVYFIRCSPRCNTIRTVHFNRCPSYHRWDSSSIGRFDCRFFRYYCDLMPWQRSKRVSHIVEVVGLSFHRGSWLPVNKASCYHGIVPALPYRNDPYKYTVNPFFPCPDGPTLVLAPPLGQYPGGDFFLLVFMRVIYGYGRKLKAGVNIRADLHR